MAILIVGFSLSLRFILICEKHFAFVPTYVEPLFCYRRLMCCPMCYVHFPEHSGLDMSQYSGGIFGGGVGKLTGNIGVFSQNMNNLRTNGTHIH